MSRLQRGLSGHCALYDQLGLDTSSPQPRQEREYLSDRDHEDDPVAIAMERTR